MTPPRKMPAKQHLEWLPAAHIEMTPPSWGRPLRPADVRCIADTFDPDKFGALVVWKRPQLPIGKGRLMLLDGQHRLASLRLIGYADQSVPCLVYEGLTNETAAELSLGLQERRNLHALDKHRAMLVAHDLRAVEVSKVLTHLGLELSYTTRATDTRRISAIVVLSHVWDRMGATGLERVLTVCDEAWEGTSAGFSANIIKLVMLVVCAHNGQLDDAHLAKVLSTRSPAAWIVKDSTPRRSLSSIAQDVVIAYNRSRRGDNRLPEMTPGQYETAGKRAPVSTRRGRIEGRTTVAKSARRMRGPGRYSKKPSR